MDLVLAKTIVRGPRTVTGDKNVAAGALFCPGQRFACVMGCGQCNGQRCGMTSTATSHMSRFKGAPKRR